MSHSLEFPQHRGSQVVVCRLKAPLQWPLPQGGSWTMFEQEFCKMSTFKIKDQTTLNKTTLIHVGTYPEKASHIITMLSGPWSAVAIQRLSPLTQMHEMQWQWPWKVWKYRNLFSATLHGPLNIMVSFYPTNYAPEAYIGNSRCGCKWPQHELQHRGSPADYDLGDWGQEEQDSSQIPILVTEKQICNIVTWHFHRNCACLPLALASFPSCLVFHAEAHRITNHNSTIFPCDN